MSLDLSPLVTSWVRSLRARNLAENTIRVYERAARALADYLPTYEPADEKAPKRPEDLDDLRREHIEAFIVSIRERTSQVTAHQYFRSIKTFFSWLVDEEEIDRSPMRTMKAPHVDEQLVPLIPDNALVKLLAACTGRGFAARRDTAIITLFLDTGLRLSELTARCIDDLDLNQQVIVVRGKGGKMRSVPFGKRTSLCLDRYIRALAKHGCPTGDEDPLWVGVKSKRPLTIWGVGQMLERRCEEAGIPKIHAHQFRHTFAHLWMTQDGNEVDLMRIAGWTSREMVFRYGASAGQERAREAHKKFSPADRLKP